jgi:hypothetical protein
MITAMPVINRVNLYAASHVLGLFTFAVPSRRSILTIPAILTVGFAMSVE